MKQAVVQQMWSQAGRKRLGQSVDPDALGVVLSIVNLHEPTWHDESQTMRSGERVEVCVFMGFSKELIQPWLRSSVCCIDMAWITEQSGFCGIKLGLASKSLTWQIYVDNRILDHKVVVLPRIRWKHQHGLEIWIICGWWYFPKDSNHCSNICHCSNTLKHCISATTCWTVGVALWFCSCHLHDFHRNLQKSWQCTNKSHKTILSGQVLELAFGQQADKGAEAPTQSERQSWLRVKRRSQKNGQGVELCPDFKGLTVY